MADRQDELRRIEAIREELTPLMTRREEICPDGARPSAENRENFLELTNEINELGGELQGCQAALQTLDSLERDDEALAASQNLGGREQLPQAQDEYRDRFLALTTQSQWNPEDVQNLRAEIPEFYNIDGSSAAGAILVPTETERDIIMDAAKESPLLAMSDRLMVGWRARNFPRGEFIGVAPPRNEGDAYLMKDASPSQNLIEIGNYGFIMSHPNEYADDAFGFNAHLSDIIAPVFAETFEEYAVKGENGETDFTNQAGGAVTLDLSTKKVPLGLLNETADYVASVTSTTSGGSPTYEDITAMRYAVRPQARNAGVWYAGSAWLQAVESLKDADNRPLWQPSLQEGQPDRLRGRAIWEGESLPDPAASVVSSFYGRFSKAHKAFIRRGITVRRSQHYFFGNNSEALAVDVRFGAGVLHKGQIAKLVGAA